MRMLNGKRMRLWRMKVAIWMGLGFAKTTKALGLGQGEQLGGRVCLYVYPMAIHDLAKGKKTALISGTNGKTTTTSLLRAALALPAISNENGSGQINVISNTGGANLPSGITTALFSAHAEDSFCVFEVDESYLGEVARAVLPKVIVLLNLSRDQLDRVSEVKMLAEKWKTALELECLANVHLVVNADDPMVVWAVGNRGGGELVTWVGGGATWSADATTCPNCGGYIRRDTSNSWFCECDLKQPEYDWWLEDNGSFCVEKNNKDKIPILLDLPGSFNRSNALMATVAATFFGIKKEDAFEAMRNVTEVAGRYKKVKFSRGNITFRLRLLLAKNPAGWCEIFDILDPSSPVVVMAINAKIADGQDTSWLWDVPFEIIGKRYVVSSGERGWDLGVRLKYAQVEHKVVTDLSDALSHAVDTAIQRTESRGGKQFIKMDYVANYTAFQSLQKVMSSDKSYSKVLRKVRPL